MTAALHDLSMAELSRLIAARKLSPVELVEALIRRVEQYDAQTHAFITPTFELALQRARQAEAEIAAGRSRGPLHGIPFALKDIYDTRGILTSAHSRIFVDRIPAEDATATAKLYDAGAVLLGKLATHEMAHAGPSFDLPWPPARNPWNLTHFTGGSSTGSGAAVAAGLVPMALGSDTGGSIRGPASYCGVVGLMPTFGLVGRAGVITNSYTFDHCGPLARTVEDCALTLQALAGYDPKDAGSLRRPIPRYQRRSARICGGSASACSATTGNVTSRHRTTSGRPWRPRSTCCAGSGPSWRNAGYGRSPATTTSRSSSRRPRSSASTRRS